MLDIPMLEWTCPLRYYNLCAITVVMKKYNNCSLKRQGIKHTVQEARQRSTRSPLVLLLVLWAALAESSLPLLIGGEEALYGTEAGAELGAVGL